METVSLLTLNVRRVCDCVSGMHEKTEIKTYRFLECTEGREQHDVDDGIARGSHIYERGSGTRNRL